MSGRSSDLWLAAICVGLGALGLLYLVPQRIGDFSTLPALLPTLGFSTLALFGLGLLTNLTPPAPEAEDVAQEAEPEALQRVPLLPVIAVLVAYSFLLRPMGFLAASAVALFVLLLLYRVRRPLPLLTVTTGTIAVVHVGIERLLGTLLPDGFLLDKIGF